MQSDLEFAHQLADLADGITSGHLEEELSVEFKDDGSWVTAADVAVERAVWDRIEKRQADDSILGEELGSIGRSRRGWIVDGIDGTRAFASGEPEWGTLIALEEDGEVTVGVASSPGLRLRWWASVDGGSWTADLTSSGISNVRHLHVSEVTSMNDARGVVVPPLELNHGWRQLVARRVLEGCAPRASRGHGPLLAAGGRLDVSVHLWGGPWDHAPFVVIVEEAGGRFTDLWGGRRIDTHTAIFSNGALHDAVLALVEADRGPEPADDPRAPGTR